MDIKAPFTHILVPTDGSQNSVQAGRLAIRMAALHNARLTLLYVLDTTIADEIAYVIPKNMGAVKQELEAKGRTYLDYLARLAQSSGVKAERVIRHGTPYSEIADLAREQDADLIVIGRVGCRGARCALVGSVAERVIEYAHCPVLVVSQPPASAV
jgi:nucleotide-binding universal stress UspA family protein